jgi:octaprenyl-diphosphate synthase
VRPQLAPVDLATVQRPIRFELEGVHDELRRIILSDFRLIGEVNEHLTAMKGKLFRPTLLLLSARATGEVVPVDIRLAAVVELIHLATLVHDDSVDHSVLRRGQPTINALFSHQVAVIMGDYLYSRAIIELVELDDPVPLRVMSRVTNEMTIGEMRELEAYDVLDYSEDDYDRLITSKTASLMAGACDIGARRASPSVREALRRYGLMLGMAFQIADDVLDYTESESVTGKPTGHDLKEHKITLPLIAAVPRMAPEGRRLVEQLMAAPDPSDDLIGAVSEVVRHAGGVDIARTRAVQLTQEAETELDIVPAGPARDALTDCLAYVVDRRS